MKTAFLIAGFLGLNVMVASAQETKLVVPYTEFRLANGLEVVLQRDTTAPVVATNIWYHVGSANEQPHRTGFAHLFEHLMFEGSRNVPEGKIDEWTEPYGAATNGSTDRDRTNYFQSLSSNALDLMLFIEADRMGYLLDAAPPDVVDKQRDIVKNERRMRVDNAPYGIAWPTLSENLYPDGHPYQWPVIGYMQDLSAAGYEDVAGFYRTYYTPSNASLVIVGDIDPAQTRQWVEKEFGPLPPGETVVQPQAPPVSLQESRLLVLEDRVQLPRLFLDWPTPPAYSPGSTEVDAIARLLAGGKSSRLYDRLVRQLQIAQDVYAFSYAGRLSSDFIIISTARPGHSLGEIAGVIEEEISRLATEPPTTHELDRVVNKVETDLLSRMERVLDKADLMNEFLYYTGNPDYFNEALASYKALSPDDVSAAARHYLDAHPHVSLSVVPTGADTLAVPGSHTVTPKAN